MTAARLLDSWGSGQGVDSYYVPMARYLGYRDIPHMMENFNEEDERKLDLLIGPYGYTIYKVWLIQRAAIVE